jgi:hypothetical protein
MMASHKKAGATTAVAQQPSASMGRGRFAVPKRQAQQVVRGPIDGGFFGGTGAAASIAGAGMSGRTLLSATTSRKTPPATVAGDDERERRRREEIEQEEEARRLREGGGLTDAEREELWDSDAPIALPLVDPWASAATVAAQRVAEERAAAEDGMTRADDAVRKPDETAVPFHLARGELMSDDQLFVVQLPSQLPIRAPTSTSPPLKAPAPVVSAEDELGRVAAQETAEAGASAFKPTLGGLEGYAGRLEVHRSGRVTLRLTGGITFDVEQGSASRFLEEVVYVNATDAQLMRVGQVRQHVMVMPNTDSLSQGALPPLHPHIPNP